jgi:hypothetical protein
MMLIVEVDECDVCGKKFRKGQKIICFRSQHVCSIECCIDDEITYSIVKAKK